MKLSNQLANHHSLTDLTPEESFVVSARTNKIVPYVIDNTTKTMYLNPYFLHENQNVINFIITEFSKFRSQTALYEVNSLFKMMSNLFEYDFSILPKFRLRFCTALNTLFSKITRNRYKELYQSDIMIDKYTVLSKKDISILLSLIKEIFSNSEDYQMKVDVDFIVTDEDGFTATQSYLADFDTEVPDFDHIEL
jgi:hypothetical protein